MATFLQTARETAQTYKKQIITGCIIAAGIIVISFIAWAIYNGTPKVVYQPANACDLLTLSEAQTLLGNKAINGNTSKPVISGNVATSNCTYSDLNVDQNSVIVAAVVVRSAVNDNGVQQNKSQFVTGRPVDGTETVQGVGDSAYFNEAKGQLNILDGRNWIIVSYGVGSTPQANKIDDDVALAHKVLQ
ncbi:MAG TPA: hypothetical protein VN081_05520 [Dongiaceae bacterium]|nr:hypothetical protein [Dongiaceae bacterium]